MQTKISLRRTLLVVFLIGFAFSPALIFYLIPTGAIQNASAPLIENIVVLPKQERAIFGLPINLKIPRINVDTTLEYVGLTPQGEVGVPDGPSNAAWFDLGPRPGENGSSVIDGHYGWKNGIPAVFDNLNKLREGDKLYVEDEKGTTTTFVVRESRKYGENEDVSGVFGSSDGNAHLNLITCGGVWNKAQKSYSDRLVVFADKVLE